MTARLTKLMILVLFFMKISSVKAQIENSYYLPDIQYDTQIEDPKSFLNYQIGEWHITHDQLYRYMKSLCESSPKCIFEEIARTHENRPLVNLIISSEKNLANLDEIKNKRSRLIDPEAGNISDFGDIPLVLYQGYSIHGNESSGSNASTLVAYYLLAGKSEELEELLENCVIILDPSYNPDGLNRFSTWANMHKHHTLSSDPRGREFNEVWPAGRTNHYWFDLNRDWIFNIHPESKGRIKRFQEWQPDILTDHHEMGSNSTFFFQPGVPSRTNPNTPKINQTLTEKLANYHASFLDSIGSLYFTKERFDDYYYGKGSTYPDINGCVGILFEQASTRGHLRETENGIMSFPFTIRNQVVTSMSTQRGALNLKDELLAYKQDFFKKSKNRNGSFVFETEDYFKASFFIDLLNRHKISVYELDNQISVDGHSYRQNDENNYSYVVPKNQRQSGLIKTIFERVNKFPDSLFYDVSAWTLPLAFNMYSAETNNAIAKGDQVSSLDFNNTIANSKSYALSIAWNQYNAPTVLYQLQKEGIKVRIATEPTEVMRAEIPTLLSSGTLIIPLRNQKNTAAEIFEKVNSLSDKYKVHIQEIDSGYSPSGSSIGSPDQTTLDMPKIAMIVGEGVTAYEAGSSWYQLDMRLHIPFTMIDKRQIRFRDLDSYNVLILPDGRYNERDMPKEKIQKWVEEGGTIIAMRRAIDFTNKMGWTKLEKVKGDSRSKARIVYDNMREASGAQVIGGAIFSTEIELNHPLFFGYEENILPVFKRGTQFYAETENSIASPMKYTEQPVLSGYTSRRNRNLANGAVAVHCAAVGGGKIIALVDNPNFRGYWLGGSKLFANCIFFHDLIASGALQR